MTRTRKTKDLYNVINVMDEFSQVKDMDGFRISMYGIQQLWLIYLAVAKKKYSLYKKFLNGFKFPQKWKIYVPNKSVKGIKQKLKKNLVTNNMFLLIYVLNKLLKI